MKESGIEKAIQIYIKSKGGWSQRLHSGMVIIKTGNSERAVHMAEKGSPDLIACVDGKFYAIEVKSDDKVADKWMKLYVRVKQGEKLPKSYHREEAQIEQSKKIYDAGGIYILASSVDDVREVL